MQMMLYSDSGFYDSIKLGENDSAILTTENLMMLFGEMSNSFGPGSTEVSVCSKYISQIEGERMDSEHRVYALNSPVTVVNEYTSDITLDDAESYSFSLPDESVRAEIELQFTPDAFETYRDVIDNHKSKGDILAAVSLIESAMTEEDIHIYKVTNTENVTTANPDEKVKLDVTFWE